MHFGSRSLMALLASVFLSSGLVACTDSPSTEIPDTLEKAAAANQKHKVADGYQETPQVIPDDNKSGYDSLRRFFTDSDQLILSGTAPQDQLTAASVAVMTRTPVMAYSLRLHDSVVSLVRDLGVSSIVTVGNVQLKRDIEGVSVAALPQDISQLSDAVGKTLTPQPVQKRNEAPGAVAALEGDTSLVLTPGWDASGNGVGQAQKTSASQASVTDQLTPENNPQAQAKASHASVSSDSVAQAEAESSKSSRSSATQSPDSGSVTVAVQEEGEGDKAPIVIASPQSGLLAVANARACGAQVRMLDYPDPRINDVATRSVAGLADKPLIALGSQFGSDASLTQKIRYAESDSPELPGGGKLVFPGRRMIALYGHPSGPDLGVMGEQNPKESVARVEKLVDQYQKLTSEPVIPAFEIIGTVASADPGVDGNYSNEFLEEDLVGYVDAITKAGGYAVIDLQPGRGTFLEQAKLYTNLLKRPNVGLALDAEWKLGPEDLPAEQVGHAEASEINETIDWLAALVKENNLPQKAFVLHQFQVQMLRDRENIDTDRPELAYVLHADGHGFEEQKMDTWNVLRQGLSPNYFMAWKNFYDEDQPMFTPEQTYKVQPRPWFVSYQ